MVEKYITPNHLKMVTKSILKYLNGGKPVAVNICPQCGALITSDNMICEYCGAKINKDKLLLEVNKAICNNLKALEQEPRNDLISRQAAIDDLQGKDPSQIWDTADIEVWVNSLPSAQPQKSEG